MTVVLIRYLVNRTEGIISALIWVNVITGVKRQFVKCHESLFASGDETKTEVDDPDYLSNNSFPIVNL